MSGRTIESGVPKLASDCLGNGIAASRIAANIKGAKGRRVIAIDHAGSDQRAQYVDVHAIDVVEQAQRQALAFETVGRTDDRNIRRSDRRQLVEYARAVLRFHAQDHGITGPQRQLGCMTDDRHLEGIVAIARPQTQAIARQRIAIGTACDQRDVMPGAMQPGTNQAADRTRAEDRVACQLLLILPAFGAGNGSVAKALCVSVAALAPRSEQPAPFMTFAGGWGQRREKRHYEFPGRQLSGTHGARVDGYGRNDGPQASRRGWRGQGEGSTLNRIGIEAISVFGLPPVPFINLAADLGCANISILPVPILPNPHGYPPFDILGDPALRGEMKAALRDRGVAISLAEGFGVVPEVEAEDRRPDLDAVAELGAKQISLGCRDPDLARAYDQFALLAEMAAERGMTSTTEFAPTLAIKNLRMALDAVRHVGRRDYRLTIDAMHLIRSGSTVADLAAIDPDVIGYFQICDVPLVSEFASYSDEARAERRIPGDGELPLLELLKLVPRDRIVGLEVPLLTAASAGVSPFDRLRPAVEATRALLDQLDQVPADV